MAERNWAACFLYQDLDNTEKVSYPASRKNFTDENLKECFRDQMKCLIQFGDNKLMLEDIECNDMVNVGGKSCGRNDGYEKRDAGTLVFDQK